LYREKSEKLRKRKLSAGEFLPEDRLDTEGTAAVSSTLAAILPSLCHGIYWTLLLEVHVRSCQRIKRSEPDGDAGLSQDAKITNALWLMFFPVVRIYGMVLRFGDRYTHMQQNVSWFIFLDFSFYCVLPQSQLKFTYSIAKLHDIKCP